MQPLIPEKQSFSLLILFSSLLVGSLTIIASLVNSHVPNPYMDEIFHIPQAIKFVQNRFTEWDDKITTLPGLYLFSYVYEHLGMNISSIRSYMGTSASFRSLNLIFTLLMFIVLGGLLKNYAKAFRLTLFPLTYFFAFLYYTDVGSCLFVLLSVYFARKNQIALSGLCSLIAVLFRQSNIIWAFWIVLSSIIESFESTDVEFSSGSIFTQSRKFIGGCLTNFFSILIKFWSFALLAIGFLAFVKWNNGLTVGDRSNHIATTHVSQLFYFFSFVMLMEPGIILFRYLLSLKSVIIGKWKIIVLSLLVLTPIFIYLSLNYSYVHKFILSDNRHYIFYLWRRLFKIHIIPEIQLAECIKFSPIYVLALLIIIAELRRNQKSSLWIGTFLFCTALNLIPLPLIEFRYFIIPFMILNLNTSSSDRQEFVNILWYLLINGATLYMFLFKPFVGPDGNEARFMW
ncbi:alpha-2-glucosyltransferase [Naegleria gruberi]|uniref:Dol-P-Glc:Glc(2)Man(9)GlcNAc(2)-PP-Dol alpha-1,2-glucosyltransferase n=1 Tax=Naegleria gruberi TaxID=5762 RepID=D2VB91_NAEGR|nr:alpha-2-glucosyltransferase [Naegleria gruberi]EFC45755.1 alpha-2-glucosyltransferase [Naegleria gruberi]|eukprot:XP_002678499.1 alpha-2-glucosyltransferase [Naegleria gruberi strain NEG-M]